MVYILNVVLAIWLLSPLSNSTIIFVDILLQFILCKRSGMVIIRKGNSSIVSVVRCESVTFRIYIYFISFAEFGKIILHTVNWIRYIFQSFYWEDFSLSLSLSLVSCLLSPPALSRPWSIVGPFPLVLVLKMMYSIGLALRLFHKVITFPELATAGITLN